MSIHLIITIVVFSILITGCGQKTIQNTSLSSEGSQPPPKNLIIGLSKQEIIEQVMVDSGLDFTIVQLPTMVAAGYDQQPKPPISRSDAEKFKALLVQAHDAAKIRQIMVGYFDKHYDEKQFPLFLAMLQKPLSKKMTSLEQETQNPRVMQEMMQSGNIIMSQASVKRLELVRKLEQALDAATLAVEMQMMISSAMIINMNKIVSQAQRMDKEHLMQMLRQMRMQAVYPTRQFILLNMVYAYDSVSDDELSVYIQDAQSKTGLWGTALIKGAWLEIGEEIALDLAARMERSFVRDNAL